jgi:flavin-dependent dehydrogenase
MFLRHLRDHGLTADAPLQGATLPLKGATEQVASDRILLAGDTAGFVDAFTGEGIYFAMHSGKLAAQTLLEAAGAGDFSAAFLDRYRLRCKEAFLDELRTAIRLTEILYRFPGLFLRTAVRHREVVDRYLDFFGGKGNYTRFSRWFAMNFLRLYLSR